MRHMLLGLLPLDASCLPTLYWPVGCWCRFRAVHEEVVKLDQDFGATFSGVLTDDDGRVRALWGSYAEQVGPGGVEGLGRTWHHITPAGELGSTRLIA